MTITTSPAPSHGPSTASFDALSSLRLPLDLCLTSEQFERLCAENREAVLELAADGRLIWMPPATLVIGSLCQQRLPPARPGPIKGPSQVGFPPVLDWDFLEAYRS